MIYDCFTFFNELDLLEIRLNVLDSVADKFVLVEATKTFSNLDKPLYFKENKERFSKFKDKIIHIIVDDYPEFKDAWTFEWHQRNCISRGLSNCELDDVVLISDLDEIPNPEIITKYRDWPGVKVFKQLMFYFYLNSLNIRKPYWTDTATKMLSYQDFLKLASGSAQEAKFLRGYIINNGGWHFSYLGGAEKISNKIKSFAHQEYNLLEYTDVSNILEKLEMGADLYDKKNRRYYVGIKIDKVFPEFLQYNKEKYSYLMRNINKNFIDSIIIFVNKIKYDFTARLKNMFIPKAKKTIRRLVPSTADLIKRLLEEELVGCKNVLDLGCGERSPLRHIKNNPKFNNLYSVGVDIFSPYIMKNLEKDKIHSKYLNQNIFDIDFPEKSFDCAIMFDVIEHFKRQNFLDFLPKLEKIAKKIIIITPNGFVEQEAYDGNPYQEHLSGWTEKDFKSLGFKCFGLSGLKIFENIKIKPLFLKVFLSDVSQLFIYKKPRAAFHLIAIKK